MSDNYYHQRIDNVSGLVFTDRTEWISVCPICDGMGKITKIQRKHIMCIDHYREYGRKRSEWPEWVKFLVNDHEKMKKQFDTGGQRFFDQDETDFNQLSDDLGTEKQTAFDWDFFSKPTTQVELSS